MSEASVTSLAYQKNKECHLPGLKSDQVTKYYNSWSSSYDKLMVPGTYNGPQIAFDETLSHIPLHLRSTCRVLDVAAGTGQLGTMLAQAGFRFLDAVEPSPGMLQILREKGVYCKIYQDYMGNAVCETKIPRGTYDVVAVVGGFGEGHLPVTSVDDMITATKPGGLVVIVMRHEYLTIVDAYRDKLEPHLASLEERNYWTRVTRKVVPNYFCGKDGFVLTYKVL
ncbi:methyltransferase-like protein 27 isoform X2 [Scylla paramamosain]